MKRLLHLVVLVGLLIGCRGQSSQYDNAITEEAFRFLFDRFPTRSEEIAYCVVWGHQFESVPRRFLERFGDVKRKVVSYSDVKTDITGTNVTFWLKGDTHGTPVPVAVFQVVHLAPLQGKKRMEIAWAYRNQAKRELVVLDEGRMGFERFSVVRELPAGADGKTEQPVEPGNRRPAPRQ